MEQQERSLRWMRLDNAALIFPAALRRRWSNAYRISFTFTEPVDPALLQRALEQVAPRFPSVIVRLRRSAFWYYLEELPKPPAVQADESRPLRGMRMHDVRRCAIRVLYYRCRMAVEYFHSVTDGTGALVFAKTLAAAYVRLRYGVAVPASCGVKDLDEPPRESELEDSFRKHIVPVPAPRDGLGVYRLRGTPEPDGFLHVTLGIFDSEELHARARAAGVTVTAWLCAALLRAIMAVQDSEQPRRLKQKRVKVQIPVNLRKLYGGETMRNFVAVANIGVDPRLGDYSFDELVQLVHHQMRLTITPKNMAAIFTQNVRDEMNVLMKAVPLTLKNIIMRLVFDRVGENVSCLSLSNLGQVELPPEMAPYVERVEFVLGPQASSPYNASCTSWQGKTYFNIVRNSLEPKLEREFFSWLVRQGFHVKIESNEE